MQPFAFLKLCSNQAHSAISAHVCFKTMAMSEGNTETLDHSMLTVAKCIHFHCPTRSLFFIAFVYGEVRQREIDGGLGAEETVGRGGLPLQTCRSAYFLPPPLLPSPLPPTKPCDYGCWLARAKLPDQRCHQISSFSPVHWSPWLPGVLSWASFFDSGTRFWFAALWGKEHERFRFSFCGSNNGWSETLSPVREFGSECKSVSHGVGDIHWGLQKSNISWFLCESFLGKVSII